MSTFLHMHPTMKEYAFEEGEIDITPLQAMPLHREAYSLAHQSLPIACHDIFIEYQGGILLIVRDNLPVKDTLWMVGGRINRGMPIVQSLQKKVKEECGLQIDSLVELGSARTLFKTDPFGHGKGTDTINLVYFARGQGKITLDHLHKQVIIVVKPADYTASFRKKLHPYVRDFMDKAMALLL